MNTERVFLVTFWDGGLLKKRVPAQDAQDVIHILHRAGIRPAALLSIREVSVVDTVSGLQRAVDYED